MARYVRDRRDLVVQLRERVTYCGRCGALMVLILPKPSAPNDFEPFYGCSDYDIGCRASRDIGLDGEPVENDLPWWSNCR